MKQKTLKTAMGFGAVSTLLVALFGGDLVWSYWQGVQGLARDSLRDATSITFDLQRLHQAIEDLGSVQQKNRQTAAKLDVEIEILAEDTKKIVDNQRFAKAEMRELREALSSDQEMILVDDHKYARKTIEADLLRRLEAYSLNERQLEAREDLLAERRQMLARVIACVRESEHEQKVLADQADALTAELRLLEVAQSTGDFEFDQPSFEQARKLKAEIQKRLEIAQRTQSQSESGLSVEVNLDRRTVAERFDQTFAKQ